MYLLIQLFQVKMEIIVPFLFFFFKSNVIECIVIFFFFFGLKGLGALMFMFSYCMPLNLCMKSTNVKRDFNKKLSIEQFLLWARCVSKLKRELQVALRHRQIVLSYHFTAKPADKEREKKFYHHHLPLWELWNKRSRSSAITNPDLKHPPVVRALGFAGSVCCCWQDPRKSWPNSRLIVRLHLIWFANYQGISIL